MKIFQVKNLQETWGQFPRRWLSWPGAAPTARLDQGPLTELLHPSAARNLVQLHLSDKFFSEETVN